MHIFWFPFHFGFVLRRQRAVRAAVAGDVPSFFTSRKDDRTPPLPNNSCKARKGRSERVTMSGMGVALYVPILRARACFLFGKRVPTSGIPFPPSKWPVTAFGGVPCASPANFRT